MNNNPLPDEFTTSEGKQIHAVRLAVTRMEEAMRGVNILNCEAPHWVEKAAEEQKIMLSQQVDSDLAHLWIETPDGGRLCCPNEWVLMVKGQFYVMDNSLFRHLFPAVQLEVSNEH